MRARAALTPFLVLAAGCVIVSSTTRPGPSIDAAAGPDAGRDAGAREDGGQLDAVLIDTGMPDVWAPDADLDSGSADAARTPVDVTGLTRAEVTALLLRTLADDVIRTTYRELASEAAALERATQQYAASGSAQDLDAAREAWRRTMSVASRAEAFQIGPAALDDPALMLVGAQSLRQEIYAYPAFNRSRIDIHTQRQIYLDGANLAGQPVNARGLGAIEYLLFVDGSEHGCPPGSLESVDTAAWAALGASEIGERRADHAHALATLVRQAADRLVRAWDPAGDNFAGAFALAGQGSPYPRQQDALDNLYAALLYLDTVLKDMKIGAPVLDSDVCDSPPGCPELLESIFAGYNREQIIENLVGLQQVILGGPEGADGVGIDDLLVVVQQGAVAEDLTRALREALALARALPSIDASSLSANLGAMQELRAAIGTIARVLKVEVATYLDLRLPPGVPVDMDS